MDLSFPASLFKVNNTLVVDISLCPEFMAKDPLPVRPPDLFSMCNTYTLFDGFRDLQVL